MDDPAVGELATPQTSPPARLKPTVNTNDVSVGILVVQRIERHVDDFAVGNRIANFDAGRRYMPADPPERRPSLLSSSETPVRTSWLAVGAYWPDNDWPRVGFDRRRTLIALDENVPRGDRVIDRRQSRRRGGSAASVDRRSKRRFVR